MKIIRNPADVVSNRAWGWSRLCSEFGLSPVSRTRLTIEKQDSGKDDPMTALMQPRKRKDAVQ